MRKIISIILAVMLMFSIGVIGASAHTQSLAVAIENVEVSVGDVTAEVKLNISADSYPAYIAGIELFVNVPDGLTLKAVGDLPGTNVVFDNSASALDWGEVRIMDPDGGYGDIPPLINAAADITLTFAITDPSVAAKYDITLGDATNIYDEEFEYADLDIKAGSVTVKAAGPSVKTIAKVGDDAIVNNAIDLGEGKETDEQIGAGVGITVTLPTDVTFDDNMIWSLTTAEGKKFSNKINAGLSALSGNVKLAATFVTGSHLPGAEFNKAITGVNAIFKAGEDFYFTDAADAKTE